MIPVEERAVRRAHARRIVEVLDADRQAVERRQGVAARDGSLRAAGLGAYLDDPVLLFVPVRLLLGLIITLTAIIDMRLTGVRVL